MDSTGALLGGTGTEYCFAFSFYDAATVGSGSKLWPTNEVISTTTVTVRGGVFNVGIGDTNAGGNTLDYDFQNSDTIYLNVQVAAKVGATCAPGDGTETYETLSPRQRIYASGYAINANTLGGFSASQAATGNQIPVLNTGTLYLTGQVFSFGFSSIGSVQIGGGSATTTIQGSPAGTSTIQGFINVTGTNSTSTFSGNVEVNKLGVTGSATSSFAGGVNLGSGCFAVGGQCLTSGASIESANSWSQLQTFQSGIIAQASSTVAGNFTVSGLMTTMQQASTTQVSANIGYFTTASTTNLTVASLQNVILSTSATGAVGATTIDPSLSFTGGTIAINLANPNSWSALQTFTGGASSTNVSVSGILYAETASTTNLSVVGQGTSTFSGGIQTKAFDITGGATSTAQNGFNIASGCFAVNGTCITSGSAADGSFSTTSANYWETQQWRWATSSADYHFASTLAGTTTDALREGVTNLYYSDARARAALSGLFPIVYDSGTGQFSLGFGTTTANTWATTQTFSNISVGDATVGTITATSSASLASTTAIGRFITGNIVATSTATSSIAGPLRIGTSTSNYLVSIVGSTTATAGTTGTAVVSISNTNPFLSSGTNVLRLNVGVAPSSNCTSNTTCPRFIEFFTGASGDTGGTGVGSIRTTTNGTGVSLLSGAADIAEYMQLSESASLGDIVSLNSSGQYQRAVAGQSLIGVISNNAGFVGNASLEGGANAYIVGFAGVVQTTVSTDNGNIAAGDLITAGSVPGVGVKLVNSGYAIGQALQSYSGAGNGSINVLVFPKYVDAAVALESYGGGSGGISGYWDLSTSTGVVSLASTTNYSLFAGNATFTRATTTEFAVIGSATSSFGGGIRSSALDIFGSASSTFGNGINLATGCFAVGGVCITGSAAPEGSFSTTSADYWQTQRNFFSTSSANYHFANTLAATTTDALAEGAINKYFSNALVNLFISGSTTISKTFTANVFTALQSFNAGASSTNLSVSGTLFAETASTTNLSVVGQATSTFAGGIQTKALDIFGSATSTFGNGINLATGCFSIAGVCIGNGAGPGTNYWTLSGNNLYNNSGINIGIGTSSPYAKLAISANNGETNKYLLVIASSTANSTTTLFSVDNTGITTLGDQNGTGDAVVQFAADANAWTIGYASSTKAFEISSSTSVGGANAFLSIAKNGIASFSTGVRLPSIVNCSQALETDASGNIVCGTDASGGGGSGAWATSSNNMIIIPSDVNDIVTIGTTATSTNGYIFEVAGDTLMRGNLRIYGSTTVSSINATSTATSTFGGGIRSSALDIFGSATSTFGSGINLATGCFSINGTCIGAGGGGAQLNVANTWTALQTFSQGASSTNISASGTIYSQNASSTNLTVSSIKNQLLKSDTNGVVSGVATSSLGLLTTDVQEGSNLYYQDARVQTYLDVISKGYFFSTSSVNFWESTQSRWATSSVNYWETTQWRWATTSSDYWLTQKNTDDLAEGSTNKYYSDTLVGAYISGSSTIPHAAGHAFGDMLQWNGSAWISAATSSLGVNLTDTTGLLDYTKGGTGQNTYTKGDILIADADNSLVRLPIGSPGYVLKVTSGAPSWQPDLTGGGGGGGGGGFFATTSDNLVVYNVYPSKPVVIGAAATSSDNLSAFEVAGKTYFADSVGIATTTAGSIFSIGNVANFDVNGSTFYTPLTALSTNVTSLTASGDTSLQKATTTNLAITTLANSILSVNGNGSVISAGVGASLSFSGNTLSLNTANANTWTALQTFANASTTNISASGTIYSDTASTTNLIVSGAATSTFSQGINIAKGCFAVAGTCLTQGGGGASLSAANTWTALQYFAAGASTTNFSSFGSAFIGGNATTTIQGSAVGTSTIQGFINVVGAANSTSTFTGNVAVNKLGVTGTATSSFGGGINLGSGCVAVNGTCIGGGSGAQVGNANTWTAAQTFQAGLVSQSSSTITSLTSINSTSTNATTTSFAITSLANALVAVNGNGSAVAAAIGNTLTFSGNTLALDLTRANVWQGLQQFQQGASTTNLSVYQNLYVGGSATTTIRGESNATSTFAGGVQANALNVTSTTASSTFANGINITKGCFAVNGVCIGGGSGGTSGYTIKLAAIYATSSPGTTTVQFTGLSGSMPSFSNGTLTIGNNVAYYAVEVWGAGGGGAAQATNNGGNGGNTCYAQGNIACGGTANAQLVGATGGLGGATAAGAGGAGGSGYWGALLETGGSGSVGGTGGNTGNGVGIGGAGAHGGGSGGAGAVSGATGEGGQDFGGGGQGGRTTSTGGSGGGGGGYAQDIATTSVKTTSKFAIGSGGAGGATAPAGGPGGSGGIVMMIYATSSFNSAGNDYAEMFPVSNPSINAGDIVAVDVGIPVSMKLAQQGDRALAGVISTEPGQLLGDKEATGMRPVAFSGRVPVKVNLEGGVIRAGDRIAVSSIAGVGKKAGAFDDSVGIALDTFDGSSGNTVMMFMDLQKGTDINKVALGLLSYDRSFFGLDASSTDDSLGTLDFVGGLMNAIARRLANAGSPSIASDSFATTTVASSTDAIASSTPTSVDSFASALINSIMGAIKQLLADAANGISDIFANVLHAKEKICVDDQCLTKEDVHDLLKLKDAPATSQTAGAAASDPSLPPAPEISINGANPAQIHVGDSYVDLGAIITGPSDALNLGIHTLVDGLAVEPVAIDTTLPGSHEVKYRVIDTYGQVSEVVRTVNVLSNSTDASSTPATADTTTQTTTQDTATTIQTDTTSTTQTTQADTTQTDATIQTDTTTQVTTAEPTTSTTQSDPTTAVSETTSGTTTTP